MYEQAGAGAAGQGFDPSQFGDWNVHFGGGGGPQGGGFRTMTEDEMREMFGDANPFSDFFQTFFGGATGAEESGRRTRGRSGRQARAGRDVEQEIQRGLGDANHGTPRRLSLNQERTAR